MPLIVGEGAGEDSIKKEEVDLKGLLFCEVNMLFYTLSSFLTGVLTKVTFWV